MLAIMLTLLAPGDHVVSLVPADRSHPSIRSAVGLARGTFHEVTEIGAFRDALAAFAPRLAVISAIAPSKHDLPFDVAQAAIAAAHEAGCIVLMDDAHMAARRSMDSHRPCPSARTLRCGRSTSISAARAPASSPAAAIWSRRSARAMAIGATGRGRGRG
jgi:seryl-tRNA(Sec) selenium transferase